MGRRRPGRARGRLILDALALMVLLLDPSGVSAAPDGVIRVGSKSFTESYILAEVAAQIIEAVGEARVERHAGLGGTGVTYRALTSGAIDLYPEYTGTLGRVILKDPSLDPDASGPARRGLDQCLARLANTYARGLVHASVSGFGPSAIWPGIRSCAPRSARDFSSARTAGPA
jgi:osmoprotectant transport system permease protein